MHFEMEEIRQVQPGQYIMTFVSQNPHPPDIIARDLKMKPEMIRFTETRRRGASDRWDMEVHLKEMADVVELAAIASNNAADSFRNLATLFSDAIENA